jgi:NADPH:quinone reductase-like Zn-dependent oxidoreductase
MEVLINGAGGGVGTLALQYAKQQGAVVTCVDLPEKFNLLRSLGADHLIDYTQTDYTRTGKAWDFVLDVVAHRTIFDYRRALKPNGTFSMVGGAMGGGLLLQMVILGPLISAIDKKRIGLMGYRPLRADLDVLASLCEAGKLTCIIDRSFPLEKTREAFEFFATGKVQGKLVIVL